MALPEKSPSQADSDLEYIKRSMQRTNIGGLAVETQEHRKKLLENENQQWLNKFHQNAEEGFKILLKEIFHSAKDGVISLSDDIEPITINDCLVDRYGLEIMRDPERLQEYIANGGNLQQLYGYSNTVMLNLYDVAKKILDDKRHGDAIKAFTFLCNLNPGVTSFWLALGMANEQDLKWDEALEAYQVAIAEEPSDFESYLGLIRCCGSIRDYVIAKRLLEDVADNEEIKDQVKDALAYIRSKEKPVEEEEKEEEVNKEQEKEEEPLVDLNETKNEEEG